ncbi:MAG TPA: NAD-dependent epimerase/dehydratase family protein [Vicinamibacterales bacterium]
MKVLVTGSRGFVGQNLCTELARRKGVELAEYDVDDPLKTLDDSLADADVVFHLAGVNRPMSPDEFRAVNVDLTEEVCRKLAALGRWPKVILASSIQAAFDNPYGVSKRTAEEALERYAQDGGAPAVVYRLKNLFGKWCRPNYNSVTATFCHNIANDIPIQISDSANLVDLTYIDEVVSAFVGELDDRTPGIRFAAPLPSRQITLGDLASLIGSFRDSRDSLLLPDFSQSFVRQLYATYLSYLPSDRFAYSLNIKTDQRGSLAECIKQPAFGLFFVSHTKPGITRGNHYHHTKTEKFMVVSGEAIIRFRHILSSQVTEYRVSGDQYQVVDIPPGYTHSIENVGDTDLVTLFWACEVFDPSRPDTIFLPVSK